MIELYSKNTYIGKACPSSDLYGFYSRKAHLPPEGKAFIRSERGGFLFCAKCGICPKIVHLSPFAYSNCFKNKVSYNSNNLQRDGQGLPVSPSVKGNF